MKTMKTIQEVRAYARQQSPEYKEAAIKRTNEWRKKNPKRKKEMDRVYRLKNLDACLKRSREYRVKNREIVNAKQREYAKKHCVENRRRVAAWRERNKHTEKFKAFSAARASKRRKKIYATRFNMKEIKVFYQHINLSKKIKCHWCKKHIPIGKRQADHVIPVARGGTHTVSNLVPACGLCNRKKHAMLPETFLLLSSKK